MSKTVLVVGGAGYIGSVCVRNLAVHGYKPVIFDNLSAGNCHYPKDVPFILGDIRNPADLGKAFSQHKPDSVMLFAALPLVWESMIKPFEYYTTNISGTANLLEAMRNVDCTSLIFSSSCAVFGSKAKGLTKEDSPQKPESFYGFTKATSEQLVKWWGEIYGIKSVILRYFNAAGATFDNQLGENDSSKSKLIPMMIHSLINNEPFTIYGKSYPTHDGTCVRDYVHVEDLAVAHIQALEWLDNNNNSEVLNLGSGKGISNLELANHLQEISGMALTINYAPARKGDAAIIRASNSKASLVLKWKPVYSDKTTILTTALAWHRRRTNVK